MEYIIENEALKVTISTIGAEMTSVIDKASGREMIWNGDNRFWGGHGPVLFPACGGLWNGECTLNGKKLEIPKHGFVRKMEWEVEEYNPQPTDDVPHLILSIKSTEETLKAYPFHFKLTVTFDLYDNTIDCNYMVENEETSMAMPFQIGGHPSVMLPDYAEGSTEPIGYIIPVNHAEEETDPSCLSLVRVGEQGCWRPERFSAPRTEDGMIPITVDTFAHEALIFDHNQVGGFTVLDANTDYLACVTSNAPVFLIWQPQGLLSPFVCIEPWYGLCDQEGKNTELIERPYSLCALPGDCVSGTLFSMEFAV